MATRARKRAENSVFRVVVRRTDRVVTIHSVRAADEAEAAAKVAVGLECLDVPWLLEVEEPAVD